MQPHRKHGKTNLANFGNFGRMEIAIMGTPCGEIKKLAHQFIHRLPGFKIAYVDADHKTDEVDIPEQMQVGATMVFTDKIKFNRIDLNAPIDKFQRNRLFNDYDLVLVNGNHFEADLQIVVVDERKPLEKKLGKITKPVAILRNSNQTRLPEFLENHLGKELEIQPIYTIAEVDKVSDLIRDLLLMNVPRLNGLVLAGGKSERMGMDKGKIDYHGMPQREFLYKMLEGLTENTFMSCRPDQVEEFDSEYKTLPDSISGLGPFGAIISAFREFPNHAWLVVACDLPLISRISLLQLIGERNPTKLATTFFNNETDFPDPLVTIWEPKAYPEMLHFLSLGYSCPRKVLINSQVQIIQPADPHALLNANSVEEYEQVMKIISEQNK